MKLAPRLLLVDSQVQEEPQQLGWLFHGEVNLNGQTTFPNLVGDNHFTRSNANFSATLLNGVPCFACLGSDYLSGAYGLGVIPYSLESGPFVLQAHLALDSPTDRTGIYGNALGPDYYYGGFGFYASSRSFHFYREQRGGGLYDNILKSAYYGFNLDNKVFAHIEMSIDNTGQFRFFLNGNKIKDEGGFANKDILDTTTYNTSLGKEKFYTTSFSKLYLASFKLSRDVSLIRTENFTPPALPTPGNQSPIVAGDTATTTSDQLVLGNVLTNDSDPEATQLVVSRVNNDPAKVGVPVTGTNGGTFTISANGDFVFNPAGQFDILAGEQTAVTSVTYNASDGAAETIGSLSVTVSAKPAAPVQDNLWTPAEISTALWLDAADSSTATVVDGKISQWADKSGNARHATQATALAQPTMEANYLSFDGGDFLSVADSAGLQFGTGDFAVVVVANCTNAARGADVANVFISKNFTALELTNYQNTSLGYMAGATQQNSGVASGTWNIFGMERLSSAFAVRRSGNVSASVTNTGNVSNVGQPLLIGSRPPGTNVKASLIGMISEVVVLPSGFTATDLQRIEGYLAHKWDALLGVTTLVSALPSDHPYKSTAPTISGDPMWADVALLIQAPKSGTTIADAKGHTVTLGGDTAVVSTLGFPSIRFDGSGDIARIPYTSDLAWGAGDWTVEFLFHPTGVSSGTLFCDATISGGYYALRVLLGGGNIYAYMYDSSNVEFLVNCGAVSVNVLHHFAVQRIGGNVLNMYKNGVFVTSRSITSGRSMKVMSAPFTLGAYYATDYYAGHILAARKTNGIARYTADFTPPTWPLPTI